MRYQTTSFTAIGDAITLVPGDDLAIAPGILVGSEVDDGVQGQGAEHTVQVFGVVSGYDAGLELGDGNSTSVNTNNVVRVMQGGATYGVYAGVNFQGSSSQVFNDGTISGGSYGIIFFGLVSGEASEVYNAGSIQGATGIYSAGDALEVHNSGTILGSSYAVTGSLQADRIVNRGDLVGDVDLYGGDDVLDNRGGTLDGDLIGGSGNDSFDLRGSLVTGTVFGGDGNDTFLPGAGAEDFDGGAGGDVLDFRGSAGLRVSLSDNSGTGLAEGDVYLGIEHVYGSQGGADTLIGNASANVMRGSGGGDVISTGAGNDVLDGGAGADTLSGGSGNDRFQFLALGGGTEVLTDFSSAAAGNDDRLDVRASAFGGGLVANAPLPAFQFQSRADNLAQDADDRFIFRTTDTTLWYDSNGNAAGGLTLIADLQAGASMTAGDIFIV